MMQPNKKSLLILLLILYTPLFIWSLIEPKSYILWILEILPAILGIALLIIYYKQIEFTSTTYIWCFVAACLVTIGAHYSYSNVPLFNWFKDIFGWQRNNYDKLGHFFQGVLPVLISFEIFIKKNIIKNVKWIKFLALTVTLSTTAAYELIEWGTVFWKNDTTMDFLGAQGYVWDAQSDMFYALLGGVSAIFLSNKLIKRIINSTGYPQNQ